jgi:hypothetical protein
VRPDSSGRPEHFPSLTAAPPFTRVRSAFRDRWSGGRSPRADPIPTP